MKVIARKRYTITWDGDNPTYIRCADDLQRWRTGSEIGLDSLDLGDATGAILEWASDPDSEGNVGTEHDACFLTFEGHLLAVSWDWELFEYPEPGAGPSQLANLHTFVARRCERCGVHEDDETDRPCA
jgi:hypothetical protein